MIPASPMPASSRPAPSIAELLRASGHMVFEASLVARASATLYGNVGANLDERDWSAIMASADPLASAESALKGQWQDGAWLLRNAQYVTTIGYADYAPEITYRGMSQRLAYDYSPSWARGSRFEAMSLLSDAGLAALVPPPADPLPTISVSYTFTATGASLVLSHGGQLTFSVSGGPLDVTSGTRALAPTGAGGAVLEGLVTLTHASGATGIGTFLLVGSDTALVRNTYTAANPARDRVIVLGAGNDTVGAGHGNDTVFGGDGEDNILGNQGNDLIYGGNGADFIEGGQGADTLDAGAGNDRLWGGSTGTDRLTGAGGADQFRFGTTNAGVTITDFSLAEGDTLAFASGLTPGDTAFATGGNATGVGLGAADFDAVATIGAIRSDTGGANAGDKQVYRVTNTQTTAEITAAVTGGALNAWALVYDSTRGEASLYFDADWSTADGRTAVATIVGLSAADVAGMGTGSFLAWAG